MYKLSKNTYCTLQTIQAAGELAWKHSLSWKLDPMSISVTQKPRADPNLSEKGKTPWETLWRQAWGYALSEISSAAAAAGDYHTQAAVHQRISGRRQRRHLILLKTMSERWCSSQTDKNVSFIEVVKPAPTHSSNFSGSFSTQLFRSVALTSTCCFAFPLNFGLWKKTNLAMEHNWTDKLS